MLAHEVLLRAAQLVEAGWSQGAETRDAAGNEVLMYQTAGGTGRVTVNRDAAQFSAYGALCKVLSEARSAPPQNRIWGALVAAIAAKGDVEVPGGKNYLHPLKGYNNQEGRTKEEVVALLREVAAVLDPAAPVVVDIEPLPGVVPELPKWDWSKVTPLTEAGNSAPEATQPENEPESATVEPEPVISKPPPPMPPEPEPVAIGISGPYVAPAETLDVVDDVIEPEPEPEPAPAPAPKPANLAKMAERPALVVPDGPTSSRMPPIGWGE